MNENCDKINILIVSLNDKFSKNVASVLADKLDMFIADCHQMIVYDLIDPKQVIEKCGLEYFKQREKSVMKRCADFCNTVLSIDFDLFKENYALFYKSIVIYLDLPEEKAAKVANKIDFENRDKFIKKYADFSIIQDKCLVLQSAKKIINKLGEIYENC